MIRFRQSPFAPAGIGSPVLLLALLGCGSNSGFTGSACTNPFATILEPAVDSRHIVYQAAVPMSGDIGPPGCNATKAWTVDGQGVAIGGTSGNLLDRVGVGHLQLLLEMRGGQLGTQVFDSDTRNFWVLLGRELAYDKSEASIWRTDGEYDIQVTSNGNYPAWSPDGSQIAFVRYDGADTELFVVNRNVGSVPVQVTNNNSDDDFPAWSPDGTRLVFVGIVTNPELYILTLATGNVVRLTTNNHEDSEPKWKGNLIVYEAGGFSQIFTIRDDGIGGPTLVTTPPGEAHDPNWSPDGSKIVFTLDNGSQEDIWIMNANGTGHVNLTNHAARDREPAFSPDGQMITFVSDRSGSQRLWVMQADGKFPVMLRVPPAGSHHPRWRP